MRFFLFATASGPTVGPTQPPVQWLLSLWWSCRSVKPITHLHLVPRSRMLGAIPQLPQYVFMAWC